MEKSFMLLVVVFVFMICQLTNPIRRTIASTVGTAEPCWSLYFHWREINAITTMVNSATNFVIYCLLGRQFRNRLVETVLGCHCHRRKVQPSSFETPGLRSVRETRLVTITQGGNLSGSDATDSIA